MTRIILYIGSTLLAILLFPASMVAQNTSSSAFTKDAPLVYEDKWDMWPYAFLDENGTPMGFNIDLVDLLMQELNIPYKIELKPGRAVREDILSDRAHLTFELADELNKCYTHYSKSVVQLFTHSIVSTKCHPTSVKCLKDLETEKVVVYDNSCTHRLMKDYGWEENAIPYRDMKEAMNDIIEKKDGQIIWNTASLEWLMRIYPNEDLQITNFEMPISKYRVISNDTLLLQRIDSAFVALSANGKLEEIQQKWFFSEKSKKTGISGVWWYVALVAVLIMLILLIYLISYYILEHKLARLSILHANRLAHILDNSKIRMWTYDIDTKEFTFINYKNKQNKTYSFLEFEQFFAPGHFSKLVEAMDRLKYLREDKVTLDLLAADPDEENCPFQDVHIETSILEWRRGRPAVFISSGINLTRKRQRQRTTSEHLIRYQGVFDYVTADLAAFDKNGMVTNMNDRVIKRLKTTVKDAAKAGFSLRTLLNKEYDLLKEQDDLYLTQFIDPVTRRPSEVPIRPKDALCYEIHIVTVRDSNKQVLGYYASGREVTETASAYRKMQESIMQVGKATKLVASYISNINNVMGVGGLRIAIYSPTKHVIAIYKAYNEVQLTLTQSRCMTFLNETSKKAAMRGFMDMDTRQNKTIDCKIVSTIKIHGMPLCLRISFIPMFDEQGNLYQYFGLFRDESKMEHTRELLTKETAKAQALECQKQLFMHNMSYEIRTPLHNVVGFSDLFRQPHSASDEGVYVEQIKNSSTHLLQLINDILFISRLDAGMVEINKQPTDFAASFPIHCQQGWEDNQVEGIDYIIENPFKQLVINIDDNNLGRIIAQVAANAAQHTQKGHVRARYEYFNNNLNIIINDSGCGMSKETLGIAFERFQSGPNSGTGLGLPICKELAILMNGSINITSELEKGTTVYITIPCTATVAIRKDTF